MTKRKFMVKHISLYVPEALQKRLQAHRDVNWSDVIRSYLVKYLQVHESLELEKKRK